MADDATPHADVLNSTAQGQLKSIIDRVERLEVEKTLAVGVVPGPFDQGADGRQRVRFGGLAAGIVGHDCSASNRLNGRDAAKVQWAVTARLWTTRFRRFPTSLS